MKYLVFIIIILAVFFGVRTMLKDNGPYNEKEPVALLPETDWMMAGVADKGSETEESVLALGFKLNFGKDKSLNGKICNSFNGTYLENGPSFKAPSLVSTKMACSGITGEVENEFFNALSGGVTYAFEEGGLLIITDTLTGRRFFFTREAQ